VENPVPAQELALLLLQLSVEDPPAWIEVGFAVRLAVGASGDLGVAVKATEQLKEIAPVA
jgi:hypothetical protein